ncbi:MAG: hypothetical protein JW806_00560 [Sedimentisphaerales bacterium]|nr:hypothetical protein [Sedimentisphaerales bacterium]
MKKLCIITLVIFLVNSSIFANPIIHVDGQGYGKKKTFTDGTIAFAGELKLTAMNIPSIADGQFISFCIEIDEEISTGAYYDAIVNTEAIEGGKGGPSPDPLNNETAWLYLYYLDNIAPTMLPANWLANNKIAEDYGMTIWALENEIHPGYLSTEAQVIYNEALNHTDWENDSVEVLNLYAMGTYDSNEPILRQDVLARRIPAPGAIFLACIGLGMVRLKKKRFLDI